MLMFRIVVIVAKLCDYVKAALLKGRILRCVQYISIKKKKTQVLIYRQTTRNMHVNGKYIITYEHMISPCRCTFGGGGFN